MENEITEKCRLCKFFISETPQSRMHPEEPADCDNPLAGNSATLPTFPFMNGCKHFVSKVR